MKQRCKRSRVFLYHDQHAFDTGQSGADTQRDNCTVLSDIRTGDGDVLAFNRSARAQRFEELFTDVVQSSGIIKRELFFKETERELTNYLHLFEVLLGIVGIVIVVLS